MLKTQIYLTEREYSALDSLSIRLGLKRSQIIRQAIDHFIQSQSRDWKMVFQPMEGMWKERTDLPDFEALRKEADRDVL
ncbi:MAG: ribbon-helix-helix protein, CopG family [SAR324 cluster bacterium]|nr:ribbon-helix-helix protein, CopG family [SAR324 cluster bacterium]